MGRKRKHITEYEIVDELMRLEAEIFRVLKNTPKKYQFDLAQQTFDQLGYMKRLVGKALYLMPIAASDWSVKTAVLNEAFSEMGALRINLCQFVRLGAMSNETFARIDLQYNIVENNFLRLLAALAAKCGGSDAGGCALGSEPDMIRTCDCRSEGGSYG